MPKKSAATRGGGQRHKPKAQKSIELVRPASESRENKAVSNVEQVAEITPLSKKAAAPTATAEVPASNGATTQTTTSSAPQGSASARLAARRQMGQKAQHKATATLISAENYGYVRKDLIFIAILAIIMFSTIIILHFVIGG